MFVKTKLFVLLNLLAVVMLVVACGARSEPVAQNSQQNEDTREHEAAVELSVVNLAEDEKLRVLATTNIIGDLVHNVGGDMIDLTTMLPPGSDPHTFAPTPQDAAAVADTQVIFVNGLHLEEFLQELIANAGGEAPVVAVSAGVETREFEATEGHQQDEEGHQGKQGHTHEGVDPHVWLTPANAIVMVHNIEHALSQLDPANAAAYAANAAAYTAQLEELDTWVKAQIETIPAENRKMVTDHDALGYYADRYGLEIIGAIIPATTTSAEPSAQELAELQMAISQFETKAIFVGMTVNPVLAEQIAADASIQLVPLYTGSLGKVGSGVETYLDLIRYNTVSIVGALQ